MSSTLNRKFLALFGLIFVVGLVYYEYSIKGTSGVNASPIESDQKIEVEIAIPKQEDWIDFGPILELGADGEWDTVLGGHTPVGIIKNDGIYYFYYVGGDGLRSFDDGPRHRSIGVATSEDGINFKKYSGNPVMTFSRYNGEEEGANSAGITLDDEGNFVMFYGAAEGPRDIIIANARVAISTDGFNFEDKGQVLNRLNPLLYGFGDEIFPLAAFTHKGKWYVYYQPNGATKSLTLGMAWGSRFNRLPRSTGVLDQTSGGLPVHLWGNIIWLSPEKIALFVQRLWWPDSFVEVRTASPDTPHQLSEPVERYDIPDLKRAAILLDIEKNTWFMYYNIFDDFWRLMLAPVGEPDLTPPTPPQNITASINDTGKVTLAWQPATDPDTGVAVYRIYRDGEMIGETKDLHFIDEELFDSTACRYQVTAINLHGTEGLPAEVYIPSKDFKK
jgi:hypothetical protein